MRERIDSIDCLRGLAIAMVVLVHCGQAVTGLAPWLQQFAEYGGRGVELFFALSAFTLFSVYRAREFNAGAFYIRRFFRIAPMFYLAIVFYTLYASATPQVRDILLTASFLHGFSIEAINRVVPGGWSIADEMIFYLIFPWLLRAIQTPKRSIIELSASIMISRACFVLLPKLFGAEFEANDLAQFAAFNFLTQAPAFFIGITSYFMVQWLRDHPQHVFAKPQYARLLCLGAALALLLCAVSDIPVLRNYLLTDLLLLPFLIGALLSQPRVLLNAPLRALGRGSYSIYLIHFLVLDGVVRLTPAWMPSLLLLVLYVTTLGITYMLATLCWRVVEAPMIAFGHRIAAQNQAASAA